MRSTPKQQSRRPASGTCPHHQQIVLALLCQLRQFFAGRSQPHNLIGRDAPRFRSGNDPIKLFRRHIFHGLQQVLMIVFNQGCRLRRDIQSRTECDSAARMNRKQQRFFDGRLGFGAQFVRGDSIALVQIDPHQNFSVPCHIKTLQSTLGGDFRYLRRSGDYIVRANPQSSRLAIWSAEIHRRFGFFPVWKRGQWSEMNSSVRKK